ncbi:hypothetical protein BON30_43050 [Cystobacter ferrugineus]|uniref:Uncharacterized protein n=1 Tax=Cystobacter ferrugineus TaxID=83449 RepID=A0A1L9AX66_9BACT|nr:hypothetical protein BON30_43050 [Cystobacter ferrugineus]
MWLGLLGLSCSQSSGYEPQVHRLVPGWGLTTAPVSGVIEGENFLSVPTQHVGGTDAVTLDSHFEVHLGSRALDDVAWTDTRTLRVQIPEGLAPGWYPLTVVTPMGGRVELPRAYYASDRPLASLTAQGFVERPRLWTGEETHLVLTVNNPGGTRALGVRALLRPVEPGGVELRSEPEPEPQDVDPGGQASFSWKLAALTKGTVHFALEVQGHEEITGQALQAAPQTLQVEVRPRPSGALFAWPSVVTVGQPFLLTLRVKNDGEGWLRGVWPWMPSVEGVSVTLSREPIPRLVDIGPNESRDFVWNAYATSSGEGRFKARAAGIDELTGGEVSIEEVTSPPFTVLKPGELAVRFSQVPPSARVGEVFDVEVSVDNPGQSEVLGVALEGAGLVQGGQTCQVRLVSGITPQKVNLAGGQQAVFSARLQVQQPGACSFRVGAQGQDGTSGQSVVAEYATSATMPVTR